MNWKMTTISKTYFRGKQLNGKSGMTHEESWRNAAYRIFGDAPGTYGAGVSALLESKIGRPSMIWLMSLYDGAVMRMEER